MMILPFLRWDLKILFLPYLPLKKCFVEGQEYGNLHHVSKLIQVYHFFTAKKMEVVFLPCHHWVLRHDHILARWSSVYFFPPEVSHKSKKITTHPRQSPVRQLWKESLYSRLVKVFSGCVPKMWWNNLWTNSPFKKMMPWKTRQSGLSFLGFGHFSGVKMLTRRLENHPRTCRYSKLFSPRTLGKMNPFDLRIFFSDGWFIETTNYIVSHW